tara:strand:- start:3975 stop:4334 length:360 start_codon:yes stop_codon:yes gene_type:complete
MRKMGVEQLGNLTNTDYLHTGDRGQKVITTVTTEDATPVFHKAKLLAQSVKSGGDYKYKASISENMMNEACNQSAKTWGISRREAFAEIMGGKTDRAKSLWKILTEGRDFRKMQAKHYQ